MRPFELRDHIVEALENLKGREIVSLDVAKLTDVADFMVIASGTSNRHVKALVDNVIDAVKRVGLRPTGVEGRETMEWVLIDAGDVVVHVMQAEPRQFYDLERLWTDLSEAEQKV